MMRSAYAHQRGAALLAAMLTVALVATLAAGAFWQQWRGTAVEGAERQRTQAQWLLNGALDWARVILREDARSGDINAPADHLAEPWAVPLQDARLSSFLAILPSDVQRNMSDEAPLVEQVFLSGRIEDLQGRLNVTNLLQGEHLDPRAVQSFERLFQLIGVPTHTLTQLTQGLQSAQRQKPNAPLMPHSIASLAWLGMAPSTLRTLQPFVTVLPVRTPLNVNTASAEVLYASIPGLSMANAQSLVLARQNQHWRTLEAFQNSLGRSVELSATHDVKSRFFEVTGQLRMPETQRQERSVLQRDGQDVKLVSRESGSLQ